MVTFSCLINPIALLCMKNKEKKAKNGKQVFISLILSR